MTASEPLKLIVVGAGLIGPRHAQHICDNKETILVAIIDPTPKAKSLAENLSALHFEDLSQFFAHSADNGLTLPDGALICTPNHTHVPIGFELASRGIHLLIEKPVSTKIEDAKALQIFASENGVEILVGHHRRFNPFIIAARNMLYTVGNVVAVQGSWTLRKPNSYFDESPWRKSAKNGGGALLINLVHDIDILQYLFGPIDKIYAELTKKQRCEDHDVDEGACLTLKFKNGVTGTFICSDNVTSPFNFEVGTGENPLIPVDDNLEGFYRVFGSRGTLSIPDMTLYHQNHSCQRDASWTEKISRARLIGDRSKLRELAPFSAQLTHFVDLIRNRVPPACSMNDAMSALLCIDAVSRSLETGMPEYVREVELIEPSQMFP